jgi:hypothetical protein
MPFIALALFLIYLVYRLETIDSTLRKVLEQLPSNGKRGKLIGSIPEGPK